MRATLLIMAILAIVARLAAAAANHIAFELPAATNVTLAINDTQGHRIRNLLADIPFEAGKHEVEWDGRNDAGELVAPGDYAWTGLQHGNMHAVYRGSFQAGNPPWFYGTTGGWAADHSPPTALTRAGEIMLVGSTEAEWGHGLIATDADGRKLWGVRWLEKRPWCGADALATAGNRVFATSHVSQAAVWEVVPATGANHLVLERKELPPGALNRERRLDFPYGEPGALRVIGGRGPTPAAPTGELYVTDVFGREPRTYVFAPDAQIGGKLRLLRTLPVRPWRLGWLSDGRCVAVMERTLDLLDPETGALAPLVTAGLSAPYGLAVDAQDRIFVSDQGATGIHRPTRDGQLPWHYMRLEGPPAHQIKIFAADGRRLATLGREGGQELGKITPDSFFQPADLAIDPRGRLWVTEFTSSPKRVAVFEVPDRLDTAAPRLIRQFFGPAQYGGGAAMIDPKRPWRIMDTASGAVFDVNLDTGDYAAVELPWRHLDFWKEHAYRPDLPFMGRPGVVIELANRRFAIAQGGYMHGPDARWSPHTLLSTGPAMIGEYRDGIFVPLAAIGNIRMWLRGRELDCRREEQWLPEPVLAAARALPEWPRYAQAMGMAPDAPDVPHAAHVRGSAVWIASPWPREISGFLWSDANGDGRVQPAEVSFGPLDDADQWTVDGQLNLYFTVPAWAEKLGQTPGTFKLPRLGFNEAGAPVYRWSDFAKLSARPLSPVQVGADGSLLSLTALWTAKGEEVWSYPSSPQGTRDLGAEKALVAKPGTIHRVNALWGVAPGPGNLGDLFALHSIDGMVYLLTREDGLFITTVFRPYAFADGWDSIPEAKPGLELEQYSLQDECFNGHFARAEASGQGFTAGHYYLLGMSRSAIVEITGLEGVARLPGGTVKLVAGEGLYGGGKRASPATHSGVLAAKRTVPPFIVPHTVPGKDTFHGPAAEWAAAEVRASWDNQGLHMKWVVNGDTTPFINHERDFTQLFATGDACDLHINSPGLGRCRYLITMHDGAPTVIRFRFDGADTENAITYTSGVARTHVPEVVKLEVAPTVRRGGNWYVVQVLLPWRDLGIEPRGGLKIPVEMGIIFSDATGTNAAARQYWASGAAEMVADVPTEAQPCETRGLLIIAPESKAAIPFDK